MKVDKKEAIYRLKSCYVESRCSVTAAAKAFRCGRRTFLDWCKKLGLLEWMEATAKIAMRDGWLHEGAHMRVVRRRDANRHK